MTFVVEVAGRTRTIDVGPRGDRWQVSVDGRPVEVDLAAAGSRMSLLIDARSYEVAIDSSAGVPAGVMVPAGALTTAERRGTGEVIVHVNGREVTVAVRRPGKGAADAASGATAGPAVVTAPMPGRIVKLLIRAGDRVAARQGVVVVEAMKMENELRAPRAGTVRELRVAEGASVEAGATLAIIE